jgi:gamma-glutamylaminecyclotransferase
VAEHQVFVYGTLKQGFRNFHINHGLRLPGEFITVQPHALLIVGEYWLPWLLQEAPETAEGHRVIGQIYAVDDAGLADMD